MKEDSGAAAVAEEKPREIRSTKELLAEVVKKPTEYIELKALPHFYRKFLQPAHMLNTEQERFAAVTTAKEKSKVAGDC